MSMKQTVKRVLNGSAAGRIVFCWLRAGLGTTLISAVFRYVFRVNASSPFLPHFTNRILSGERIVVDGDSLSVRENLLHSGSCYINASNGLQIGEGTIWSHGVVLMTSDHDINDFNVDTAIGKITKIGRNCWLGANVTIVPGVVLGDRTIVGANSVVTKSFPEGNVVIGGCPARLIRSRLLSA